MVLRGSMDFPSVLVPLMGVTFLSFHPLNARPTIITEKGDILSFYKELWTTKAGLLTYMLAGPVECTMLECFQILLSSDEVKLKT